ncbi:MAG: hypothetical protein WC737_05680 [Parcubacteria group bacterium]|jgi:hypothetical protein
MFNGLKEKIKKSISNLGEASDEQWEEYCRNTWKEAKVLIGLPNSGVIEDLEGESPFKSFMHLAMFVASHAESQNWAVRTVSRMITHEARNLLAKQAVEGGYTHLAMIDSDHTFDADVIHRLLLYRKLVIGVRAYKRTSPHYPCIFAKHPGEEETEAVMWVDAADMGVMVADHIGFGIVLISVEVLKKLKYPYFFFSKMGEDFNFCREAREAGFKIYVDTDVEIGHLSSKIIRRADYLEELKNGTIEQFSKDMVELIQEQKNDPNVNFNKTLKK